MAKRLITSRAAMAFSSRIVIRGNKRGIHETLADHVGDIQHIVRGLLHGPLGCRRLSSARNGRFDS